MPVEVKCIKHPYYKGKRWPKVHCKYCEFIYALLHHQHKTHHGIEVSDESKPKP